MLTLPTSDLTIGDVARKTGISAYTLRFYEQAGLMSVRRNPAGHRRYSEQDLRWIVILTKMRETGMPLKDIRRYAELVAEGPGNEADRLSLLEAHQASVREQFEELRGHLAAIDRKVDIYRRRLEEGDAAKLWSVSTAR